MQLAALRGPDGEAEQCGGLGVALRLEGGERGCVALDGLRALALYGVELHRAHHAVLLRGDT